jgi:hypothetical protein
MKQFEKWNKLRGIDFRIRFSSPKQFEVYIEQERRASWTAALKQMQEETTLSPIGNHVLGGKL